MSVIRPRFLIGLMCAGASLSACNKQSGGEAPIALETAAESKRATERFGEGFGRAFRADPNSEPKSVGEQDVAPVSYTTEPEPID